MRGVLRVFLTVALALSCTGYFLAEKQVTVTDGTRIRQVRTFAPSVGDALSRLGMKLGPHDRVLPSPKAKLDSDRRIEVRRAKDVVMVLNGARRSERVTGRTVLEVLNELSVARKGALIEPGPGSQIEGGTEIVVAQPVSTSVHHDGISQPVVSNALTAGALLRQLGVALGPHDRVEPSIVAYPSAQTPVKVVRVNEVVEKTRAPIPFKRTTQSSDELELGIRKLKVEGVEGVRSRTYRTSYEDGKMKARVFEGTEIVRPAVDEVTLVGTRRPAVKLLAHSDKGGASWFNAPGLTAAHKTLPFGTAVKVTSLASGKSTTVTIRDRGPITEGRIIDLSEAAFKELAPLGAGVIQVKIEW